MANALSRRAGGSFESDRDLVDAICRGEKSAQAYFFEKYSPLIYSLIHKKIKYEDVKDAYQEFFLYIQNKPVLE